MSDIYQQVLRGIVVQYGRTVCEDPSRVQALLRDLVAKHPGKHDREINVLVVALKEQVASELLKSERTGLVEVCKRQLAARLHSNLAMTEEYSVWAVETWGSALDVRSAVPRPTVSVAVGTNSWQPPTPTGFAEAAETDRLSAAGSRTVSSIPHEAQTTTENGGRHLAGLPVWVWLGTVVVSVAAGTAIPICVALWGARAQQTPAPVPATDSPLAPSIAASDNPNEPGVPPTQARVEKDSSKQLARVEPPPVVLPETKTPPEDVKPAQTITNSIGMKLTLIPAGEFLMGSLTSEEGRSSDEGPQHRVRITKPFYLGMYEVTQAEYEKIIGRNPSWFSAAGEGKDKVAGQDMGRLPVEQVSWVEAVEFCRRLSQKDGKTYRLPTEAEWEYACRAGTTTMFNFGNSNNGRDANTDGRYPLGTLEKKPYLAKTTIVGSYPSNAFGLYDMHGNVWQWCQDWYDKDYYQRSLVDDPVGPVSGNVHIARGGGWNSYSVNARSAFRNCFDPTLSSNNLGFRVVRRVAVMSFVVLDDHFIRQVADPWHLNDLSLGNRAEKISIISCERLLGFPLPQLILLVTEWGDP